MNDPLRSHKHIAIIEYELYNYVDFSIQPHTKAGEMRKRTRGALPIAGLSGFSISQLANSIQDGHPRSAAAFGVVTVAGLIAMLDLLRTGSRNERVRRQKLHSKMVATLKQEGYSDTDAQQIVKTLLDEAGFSK